MRAQPVLWAGGLVIAAGLLASCQSSADRAARAEACAALAEEARAAYDLAASGDREAFRAAAEVLGYDRYAAFPDRTPLVSDPLVDAAFWIPELPDRWDRYVRADSAYGPDDVATIVARRDRDELLERIRLDLELAAAADLCRADS